MFHVVQGVRLLPADGPQADKMPLEQLLHGLSAAELQRVLDLLPDGVMILAPEGGIVLHANATLERLVGCDIIGRPVFDLIAPGERGDATDRLRGLETGVATFVRRTLVDAGGREIQGEITATRLPGGAVCAIVRDVTEHNQVERERKRVLSRLRMAAEANLDAWVVLDVVRGPLGGIVDFTCVDLNGRAAALTRSSRVPFRGSRLSLNVPASSDYIANFAAVVNTGRPFAAEFEVAIAGEMRWFYHEAVSLGDGVSVVARDITEKKIREEALRESEERFRSAAEFSAIGLALVAPDGRWLSVNPALCRMLGYEERELMSRAFQDITHPDDLNLDLEYLGQMLRGERNVYQMEKRYFHSSGRTVWANLTVSLVHDRAGSPSYFISQIQDMTEQRALADRIRHVEKMEAVGRLAGGIAHDFNNILASVRCNAELLRDGKAGDLRQQESQAIIDEADRAARITRQLLLFSRQHYTDLRRIDLAQVVNDMVPMLGRLLGGDIHVETTAQSAEVKADADHLQQVLMNLCINARDAMPDGGAISIVTGVREVTVPVSHRHGILPRGTYAVLSVTDTGVGISSDVMSRLFEPYFSTKGPQGSGIGLATMHGIVEQHGGLIVVTSEMGAGSTFDVYLPVFAADASRSARPDAVAAPEASGDGARVLVVDDEKVLLEATRRILDRAGYTVITAWSADMAIEILSSAAPGELPAAILTDMSMPGMNGREFGDVVATRWPAIPVAYMSGYSADLVFQTNLPDASHRFLNKPFAIEHLLEIVREMIDATTEKP